MITNGREEANCLTASSSNTRTKCLQMKPAVVRIKTNKSKWLWIVNGDLREREKCLRGFNGKLNSYLQYRSTVVA